MVYKRYKKYSDVAIILVTTVYRQMFGYIFLCAPFALVPLATILYFIHR